MYDNKKYCLDETKQNSPAVYTQKLAPACYQLLEASEWLLLQFYANQIEILDFPNGFHSCSLRLQIAHD